jgi:sugar lactone lactonase YvrE
MLLLRRFTPLVLLLSLLTSFSASAWDRPPATTFATLPAGSANPEGITADEHGNIYVSGFAAGTASGVGQVSVFDRAGRLQRVLNIAEASPFLLGLAFHPMTHELLVIDFGRQKVLSVNPLNGTASMFASIPGGSAAGPNALTFDDAGNTYVSDSFQGVIWRIPLGGGAAVPWASSPLLTTTGVPPFGANGIAFSRARDAMFVANTGNDTIVKIPVGAGGAAGVAELFVNSVNGADGLILDEDDNLLVAANQADEIVVLDPTGRVIAKLGDFEGLDRHGAPRGLLFPASLVRSGRFLYVTNLSLDLRLFGLAQTVDSQWAAEVTTHTIARIPLVQWRKGKANH